MRFPVRNSLSSSHVRAFVSCFLPLRVVIIVLRRLSVVHSFKYCSLTLSFSTQACPNFAIVTVKNGCVELRVTADW